jgi:hypothetical protein
MPAGASSKQADWALIDMKVLAEQSSTPSRWRIEE